MAERAEQIELTELPDGTDGRRLVPPAELIDMMRDPAMRDAIDTIERASGRQTAIRSIIRHQIAGDIQALHAERQIELARRKIEGKLFK